MKKALLVVMLAIFSAAAYPAENVINYIFMKDFPAMGGALAENPLKTGLIAGGLTAATLLTVNNDKWLASLVTGNKQGWENNFFDIANNGGDGLYVLAGAGILYSLGRKSEEDLAAKIVEGLAVEGLVVFTAKSLVGRERPSVSDDPLQFWHISLGDNSFPSGHTATAFMWATIAADHYSPDNITLYFVTYTLAAAVGIARIYKGAHWPSDVIAGAAIGVFTGQVINKVHSRNSDMSLEHGYGFNSMIVRYNF